MDSIGEVASANRVSPRPVGEEKETHSGAEIADAPNPKASHEVREAVVNAAGATSILQSFQLYYTNSSTNWPFVLPS